MSGNFFSEFVHRRCVAFFLFVLLIATAFVSAESKGQESYRLRLEQLQLRPQQRLEISGGWSQRITQTAEGNSKYETNRLEFCDVKGVFTIQRWDVTNGLFESNLDVEYLRSGNVTETNVLLHGCRVRAKYISGMSFYKAENGFLGQKVEEALQTTMRFFPWTGPEKMDYEFLKLEEKRAVGDVWEPNIERVVERVRRSYPDFRAQDMKSTVQLTEVKNICGFSCFTIEAKAFVPMTPSRFPIVRPAFEDARGHIEIGYTFTAALKAELPWSG